MYQHRLVPAETPSAQIDSGVVYGKQFSGSNLIFYAESDTIPCPSDWTAEQLVQLGKTTKMDLDLIGDAFSHECISTGIMLQLSAYLSDLLTLAPLKGLTV